MARLQIDSTEQLLDLQPEELEWVFEDSAWEAYTVLRHVPTIPRAVCEGFFARLFADRAGAIADTGDALIKIQDRIYRGDVAYFESDEFVKYVLSRVSFLARGTVETALRRVVAELERPRKEALLEVAARMLDAYLVMMTRRRRPAPPTN